MDLQIWMFDHLQAIAGEQQPLAIRPRAQRLLVFLLLHRGRPLTRAQIAFNLWPDNPEDRALGALRRALSDLRAALAAAGDHAWLLVSDTALRWNEDAPGRIDIDAFEQAVRQATPAALHEAVELYGGDLLAGWDEEWLMAERGRLRQLQGGALRQLVAHHRALADYDAALGLARRALAHDPLAEASHRDLIELLYLNGDRAAALAAYEQMSALLVDELGVEPMAETRALRAAIVRGASLPLAMGSVNTAATAASAEPALPALTGRDDELEKLIALWRSAESGTGRLVTVSGEAGVGKSRLARGLAEYAGGCGGLALTGHCYEFEQALPYQGIVAMLRHAGALLQHAGLGAAHRMALARLAPDVLGASGGPAPDPDLSTADPREQLFEALWQAFLALARSQPLLLVIEDVHWAAESTLDWLTYIAPRLNDAPVLVAITYRTEEVDTARPLARLNRRLSRTAGIATLPLMPLTAKAHREMVGQLSGLPDDIAGPLAERLFRETAGNPFFLHEIVRGLLDTDQLVVRRGRWEGPFVDAGPAADVPLPDSLRDLINARVERLEREAQTFIQVAAVAGRVFQYGAVQRATGWTDEPALRALDDVLARGFIGQGDGPESFAFSHHLVQEVIYAGMTAPRRTYWHGRLAEAFQTLNPDDVEALAHHFSRAGEDDRARIYYARAGDRARRLAALEDAAGYYRAAIERWPEDDPAGRAELLDKRGQCQLVLGELHAALGTFEEARALYEALGNRLRAGDIERLIGRVYWEQSDRQAALHHYHRALAILEQEPVSVELARAISSISQMHMLAAELGEALDWGERALALAERLDAEDVVIHAEHNIGIALVYLKDRDTERGLALMRASLQRALAAGLAHDAMRTYFSLAELLLCLGRYTEAQETYAALLIFARRLHSDFFNGIALSSLVQLHWYIGNWAEALDYRRQLLDWKRVSTQAHLGTVWSGRVLGMVYNDLGQADLARDALERDLERARNAAELQTTAPHLAELARAYAALGHEAKAGETIQELLTWIARFPYAVFDCIMPLVVACRWLATRTGPTDFDALQRCVGWLQRMTDEIGTVEARAALEEGRGMVLRAEGLSDQAAQMLQRAATSWEALGRPYSQAGALVALGDALQRAGQTLPARAAAEQAMDVFESLAAQLPDPELRRSFLDSPPVSAVRARREYTS